MDKLEICDNLDEIGRALRVMRYLVCKIMDNYTYTGDECQRSLFDAMISMLYREFEYHARMADDINAALWRNRELDKGDFHEAHRDNRNN